MSGPLALSYILPMRRDVPPREDEFSELNAYLDLLDDVVSDVMVLDGSPTAVFARTSCAVPPGVRHVQVEMRNPNGKVDGVMAGLRLARERNVVIADDDVRYTRESLQQVALLLQRCELVRPQNYFEPAPWHALWDTSRTLLNRLTGGDWPGTLGVNRDVVLRAGGYSAGVMFENLELARVVRAAGGRARSAPGVYVRRLPPTFRRFLGQRVRQAYDELARPPRLITQLAILPLVVVVAARRRPSLLVALAASAVAAAEMGRRRHGGRRHFPWQADLFAPLWLLERGLTSWLAVASQLCLGGVRYRGRIVPHAAHSARWLRRRAQAARTA